MTVTAVHKDPSALTMTLVAEFDAARLRPAADLLEHIEGQWRERFERIDDLLANDEPTRGARRPK